MSRKSEAKRAAGVLLPVFSLPSKYGIGCFSKEAYEFVDWLHDAGQSYWQILPLGPTSYGDSPYQSFSTFAGNPYFIDLEELISLGYVTEAECEKYGSCKDPEKIDYEILYSERFTLLKLAHRRSQIGGNTEFTAFVEQNADWLPDYALYMAVKKFFQDEPWVKWNRDIKKREPQAVKDYQKKLADEVEFYEFIQYLFYSQWEKLRAYAHEKGISIIGDIPIYVAYDSADTWAHPELFQLDDEGYPIAVAGCPPDAFSATGQLWGNPLYDWPTHQKTGYSWWMKRLEKSFSLYDVVRIDHFRGFDAYYAIPYGDPTAEFGHWEDGPGYELFQTMKNVLGEKQVIAEDLGFLTPSVLRLVKKTGYPGMKILEFAFDSGNDNVYLPHHYQKNCVVYTGTHDNDTVLGWYASLSRATKKHVREYLGLSQAGKDKIRQELIRLAMSSVANLCIIPAQDYLGLGKEARINIPSTLGTNWMWRMREDALTQDMADQIKKLTRLYSR